MERSGTARQPQLLGQKKDKFWLTVGLCAPHGGPVLSAVLYHRRRLFPLCRRFQQPADQLLPVYERLYQGRGLPGQRSPSVHRKYLLVGYRPWQRRDERLFVLPVRLAVLLVLAAASAGVAALPHGAAAGAPSSPWRAAVRTCTCATTSKISNYAVLGACLYTLSGFAVYNVFFNHFVDVVALFPVPALGAGREPFTMTATAGLPSGWR